MRRITVCCFTSQSPKKNRKKTKQIQEAKPSTEESMERPQMKKNDIGGAGSSETADDSMGNLTNSIHFPEHPKRNIIVNHDFSQGLQSWHPNSCDGFVVSSNPDRPGLLPRLVGGYAVVSNRKQWWEGIEQDITARISPGLVYSVAAVVGVSGNIQGSTEVIATLKLEQQGTGIQYLRVGKATVSKGQLEMLQGNFCLSTIPDRVVFYIEGPSAGADILVASVNVCSSGPAVHDVLVEKHRNVSTNIILNSDFSQGLESWHPNHCEGYVVSIDLGHPGRHLVDEVGSYAVVSNRKERWQGLEQDITSKVSPGLTYLVSAFVGVSGQIQGSSEEIIATLKCEYQGSATSYLLVGKTSVCKGKWKKLEGRFSLSNMPERVVFYIEGPPPGVNLLIKSVLIGNSMCERAGHGSSANEDENLIVNPNFEDGSNNWSGRGGCKIAVQNSAADGKIVPQSGKVFAVATGRTQSWHGIQQEITGRVQRKLAYEVTAIVRIYGNNVTSADVRATLWVQNPDNREQYIGIANLQANDSDWIQLQGKFLLNGSPKKIVVYLEGPPPGTDILVNSFTLKHAQKVPPSPLPIIENPAFGVNILENSNLSDGTNGWFPLGNCSLSVATGSPHVLPPMARESLGVHEPLSGRCIAVTKRTQTWMGPAQMITDKVKLFLTYQIAAWVKIGPTGANSGPQNVNVALGVDNNWVNGGQVEINDDRWHEIGSSFRIEKQPSKVMVYIQGPAGGTDFMVGGLQIFPVDRVARFKHLRRLTDKIRKRDVTLKFTGADSSSLHGTLVKVRQTQNSFPLGTCISRTNIDNEDYVNFFVNNFNWAVFGNELKWYWTESQQGSLNYKDADDMVELCKSRNIEMRGHCIFWDVDGTVQQWIKSLNKDDLMKAVQNRLTDLLTRYKGKFKHYDVNNEMLHGSFYPDRLGKDIRPYMFKTANQLDPSATLFVNDYHVEDGCDTRSNPERYIEHILNLQEQGAPVGGVGIQGHIDSPVGPVVCSALNNLGILGLPIWFTELDVSSVNEYIRAEDLEVMLREAYAHPSVEGIMLWGFWELFMSRENSHLVDAEGELNEAGRRFLALKKEWLSHANGHIDEQAGFGFRGFHGTYTVEIVGRSKKVTKTFVVEKGDTPLVLSIDLSSS